jgi:hypothetical protein
MLVMQKNLEIFFGKLVVEFTSVKQIKAFPFQFFFGG